jgi:hypothetical protein
MTVLEITILEYISPPTPELTTKVLSALKKVRSNLAAEIYPTHSRFFSPIDGQSRVYIFGSWPSLEAHREFLGNDELRERVLKDQEGLMKWVAGGHVQMNGNGVSLFILLGCIEWKALSIFCAIQNSKAV